MESDHSTTATTSSFTSPFATSASATSATDLTSSTSVSPGGLTKPQKIGLGVGIGVGVPILLAAAIGAWFVVGASAKKNLRADRVEQPMGEPIYLGRM